MRRVQRLRCLKLALGVESAEELQRARPFHGQLQDLFPEACAPLLLRAPTLKAQALLAL